MTAFMVLLTHLLTRKITKIMVATVTWYATMPGSWTAVLLLLICLISVSYIHIFPLPCRFILEARVKFKSFSFLLWQMEFACSHVVCDWRPVGAGKLHFKCEILLSLHPNLQKFLGYNIYQLRVFFLNSTPTYFYSSAWTHVCQIMCNLIWK